MAVGASVNVTTLTPPSHPHRLTPSLLPLLFAHTVSLLLKLFYSSLASSSHQSPVLVNVIHNVPSEMRPLPHPQATRSHGDRVYNTEGYIIGLPCLVMPMSVAIVDCGPVVETDITSPPRSGEAGDPLCDQEDSGCEDHQQRETQQISSSEGESSCVM